MQASPNTRTLRVPDIAWIAIPEGPFLYGEKRERQFLETFWIAKYPLTHQQYQCFIGDGGYQEARWWRDLKKPEPEASRWPQPNRPRTNVDWYEAVAYTRWLSAALGLEEGAIRLPTEQEWEKAARGEKGLAYPWGEKYQSGFANINETWRREGPWDLGQTTAVGLYPQGRSPHGVEDMAGTVWEWCLNVYDTPDVVEMDDSGRPRVLRGGSWLYISGNARSGIRLRIYPVDRNDDAGFRLLSSVPINVR